MLMLYVAMGGFAGGMLLLLAGFGWLLNRAFRVRPGWGWTVLLLLPVGWIGFVVCRWKDARAPLLSVTLGLTLTLSGLLALGLHDLLDPTHSMGPPSPRWNPLGRARAGRQESVPTPEHLGVSQKDSMAVVADVCFVGQRLSEVQRQMGPPSAVLRTGREVTYFYGPLELVSTDGVTVAAQYRSGR